MCLCLRESRSDALPGGRHGSFLADNQGAGHQPGTSPPSAAKSELPVTTYGDHARRKLFDFTRSFAPPAVVTPTGNPPRPVTTPVTTPNNRNCPRSCRPGCRIASSIGRSTGSCLYVANARSHPEAQVAQIAGSIAEFG